MTDRTHADLNAKVRATIDDAIAELMILGMPDRDQAAALMAIQAMCRIQDGATQRTVTAFAASLIVDDDEGGR
ncbi:hypothetical protein ACH0BU_04210 [Sphingomonas olei]|jgi:hypothetical protein